MHPPFICLRFCFISQELFYKLICQATQTSIEPCETKLRKTVARKLYFLCTEKYYRNSNRLGFEVTVSRPTGANLIHNEIQTFQFQNQSRLILETVKCSSSCLCGCDYACSLWIPCYRSRVHEGCLSCSFNQNNVEEEELREAVEVSLLWGRVTGMLRRMTSTSR